MGMIFTGLSPEDICELMCGEPQKETEDEDGNQSIESEGFSSL